MYRDGIDNANDDDGDDDDNCHEFHSATADGDELVSRCFNLSQPPKIISGLRVTFMKRYTVQRTNTLEIRPVEQSGKAESCRENSWFEIQLKGPLRQK